MSSGRSARVTHMVNAYKLYLIAKGLKITERSQKQFSNTEFWQLFLDNEIDISSKQW